MDDIEIMDQPQQSKNPAVVYHYTSADVLLKIVNSNSIWATNIRYLNDVQEAEYCLSMLRSRLPVFLRKFNPEFQDELKIALSETATTEIGAPYVASFSVERDSLPQWRSYCPNGNGVSIGFRSEALERSVLTREPLFGTVPPRQSTLEEVLYLEKDAWEITDAILLDCLIRLQTWHLEQGSLPPDEQDTTEDHEVLKSIIGSRICLVKHAAFAAEKEYRLLPPDPFFAGKDSIGFRSSRTTVIPYLNVLLPKWGLTRMENTPFAPFADYFIEEVIVGPTPNPDLTISALTMLFMTLKVPVPIRKSDVPYRDL